MDNSYDLCAPPQQDVNGCTLICVALLALPSLAPPGDRLPTHSLAEAQMCDFWQAGISSQNRIQHYLAVLALISPGSGFLLGKKFNTWRRISMLWGLVKCN